MLSGAVYIYSILLYIIKRDGSVFSIINTRALGNEYINNLIISDGNFYNML